MAGLDRTQFETRLITGTLIEGESDMTYYARSEGLEPITIKEMSRELTWRDIIVIGKLVRYFWKLKPEIIDTQKAKAGATGRIAAQLYRWLTPSALWLRPRRCRVVHTYHGHVFHSYFSATKTKIFLTIERFLARFCTDAIITISEQQRREISEHFKVGRADQFRVIPLGIDPDEIQTSDSRLRKEYGIADDEFVIGIIGRICEVKNHAMLLESIAKLIKSQNIGELRIRLIVIGDGHLLSNLEELCLKLGITDRVIFTGPRTDAPSLYSELDLVVLTSLNEGTPLTLIEAMCAGRPVVATEVGGIVDIMGERQSSTDGFWIWQHGITTPSRDVDTFARALQFMVNRPELRWEMGTQAQMFVKARLSKTQLITSIERLYHELAGKQTLEQSLTRTLPESLAETTIAESSV
jgi:glycosyltransferase involved in cell wall biosynthesis